MCMQGCKVQYYCLQYIVAVQGGVFVIFHGIVGSCDVLYMYMYVKSCIFI